MNKGKRFWNTLKRVLLKILRGNMNINSVEQPLAVTCLAGKQLIASLSFFITVYVVRFVR